MELNRIVLLLIMYGAFINKNQEAYYSNNETNKIVTLQWFIVLTLFPHIFLGKYYLSVKWSIIINDFANPLIFLHRESIAILHKFLTRFSLYVISITYNDYNDRSLNWFFVEDCINIKSRYTLLLFRSFCIVDFDQYTEINHEVNHRFDLICQHPLEHLMYSYF